MRILMSWSGNISTRKIHGNASDKISSKNKKLDEARKMYREEVFEDMKSNGRIWKHFIFQVRQVLVNQNLPKDLARKINIKW